jgi:hypothetical protein
MASIATLGAEVAQLRKLLHKKLVVDFVSELENLKTINEKNQETIQPLDTNDSGEVVDIGSNNVR